jgi:hypothetical protein
LKLTNAIFYVFKKYGHHVAQDPFVVSAIATP